MGGDVASGSFVKAGIGKGHQEKPEAGHHDPLARLAGGLAHDFNNILTVISGYGELMLAGLAADDRNSEYLIQILRAAGKASEIVDMILAYSGRQMLRIETIDVNPMLDSMRGFLQLYLGDAVRLRMRLCRETCPVRGDRGQLQWALLNIVMNAKEAMPDGGEIVVSTRHREVAEPGPAESRSRGAALELAVRDTGRGMSQRELERVFDPYFTTKEVANTPGLGLGLASAQGIVRQMGGSIRVDSAPDAGSEFLIRLPLAGGN